MVVFNVEVTHAARFALKTTSEMSDESPNECSRETAKFINEAEFCKEREAWNKTKKDAYNHAFASKVFRYSNEYQGP